ncbi:glycosyl transferase [Legionella quinlivanii]|uniref:Glycosyl transferase n=1 Tax=Legionella quinlivanii TaxID=45073 RepID=A0A364LL50_9GAMM|nr:glycosyltransferase family 2 protein [Legionella quinlivanii]RAP37471.1 glycosyl transferase [Legionella quinlivanii]
MKLSIVATLYKSENYINEFYQRATDSARQLAGDDYEIIFVNDGSPDNSLELAVQLTQTDKHIVVIDLSRNFGHHKAIRAGLEHSTGELVFLIDSDLEEEPEWLISFSEQMNTDKADVIYGVQRKRKGGWFERWSGALYYRILNWLIHIDHPRNITTARLMTRRYVNALLSHKELESVISCLWVITGFNQCSQTVDKHSKNSSTYGLLKKLSHSVNAVTSFSAAPLYLISIFGFIVFLSSVVYASTLIINRFLMSVALDGWTSIMVSIWLLGGLIISFIGIIGIYLAKIFSETKQRPYVIIRNIYGKSD